RNELVRSSLLRNGGVPQTSDRCDASAASAREPAQTMRVGGPTKFHAPAPPLHPRRHTAARPAATRAFRESAPPAASPTAPLPGHLATAQPRILVAPKSARPTAQSACKI